MSNGKGMGILGLIFGLIGAGLGGYAFVTVISIPEPDALQEPVILNSWYLNYSDGISLPQIWP